MIASADIAASINFRRWTARGRQAIVPIQKPHIGSIALKIDADLRLCEPSPCAGSPLSSLVAGMASVAASALRSVQRHVAPRVPVARSEKRSPKLLLLSVVAFATLFASARRPTKVVSASAAWHIRQPGCRCGTARMVVQRYLFCMRPSLVEATSRRRIRFLVSRGRR